MVSRRNYMTIMLLMAIIFFLFFFMGAAKDRWNDYQNNVYFEEKDKLPKADSVSHKSDKSQRDNVVYLGDIDLDAAGDTIRQWGIYSKRTVQAYASLTEWPGIEEEMPEVLLINPDYLKDGKDVRRLEELAERGVPMIFCKLPQMEGIRDEKLLYNILGIKRKAADSCRLGGIKLFGGFLLGGEVHYIANETGDEAKQDMTLEVPWYQLRSGTKTYMTGVLDDEQMKTVKNEQLPALIWKASYKDAKIFVINGTYLEDISGIGILSAMMAELHSYELYPVVNAQSVAILNGPDLTPENAEELEQLYSRNTRLLLRDVVFPGLAAASEVLSFPMTCLMTLKINSTDSEQPISEDLEYYLKYFNEQKAEMGISLLSKDGAALAQRAEEMSDFLTENKISYQYGVLYAEAEKLTEAVPLIESSGDNPALSNVNTVISEDTGTYDLLDYIDETTTIQGRTSDACRHTYTDDFRLRAMETGLGYSNVFLDMKKVVYPETEEDYWENLSVQFSSNLDTYWKPFRVFDSVVLSESDKRVRKFLALDYADNRKENIIELEVSGLKDEAWFVLRTHGEAIEQIEGASWDKIEQNAYLLTVTKPQVTITLKQEQQIYFYDE